MTDKDKKLSKAEDTARRDEFIDLACKESGMDRDYIASEMDFAKEHGIKYKVYAVKGYWNIPHDLLLEAHSNGSRRRSLSRKIAEERGRDRHEIEKEMIDAKYNLGLRIGYFKTYDWDLLSQEQKDQMLLRPWSQYMSEKYRLENADTNVLNEKDRFYQTFSGFIGRKWMRYRPEMTKEEFLQTISDFTADNVIFKPIVSSGGRGIRKFSLAEGPEAIYDQLQEMEIETDTEAGEDESPIEKDALIEEFLLQHPDMSRLCSESINTIRAVTLYWNGEYHLLYTLCRMGAGDGTPVDSFTQGGLLISVDKETGRFNTVAVDHWRQPQTRHPASGTELVGFQVPCWEEILAFLKKAAVFAYETAGLGYVGWDVAVTPEGPVMIEGNNWPDCGLIQLCHWIDSRKGVKYLFDPYL